MVKPLIVKFGDQDKVAWHVNASLLGCTVELRVRDAAGQITTPDVEIDDFPGGIVTWQMDGTLPVGQYEVELKIFTVTDVGSITMTAPTSGTALLVVEPVL